MSSVSTAAMVQPVRNPFLLDEERRNVERHLCSLDATSHSVESGGTLSWGAVVTDISATGLGVTLCYPFRPGTYLAIEVPARTGMVRTLMVRVVNVHDQPDGQWRLGCEFIKPLTPSDMEILL